MLLLAAGVVASGGGLGGIGSLGQVASGPSLPDTGLAAAPETSLGAAEIVGAELPSPAVPVGPSGGGTAELAAASPLRPVSPAAVEPAPVTRTEPPAGPIVRRPETPLTDTGRSPRLPAAGQPGSNPVDDIEDTTRGLTEALPAPLQPLANRLIDLLLGPPPK